MSTISEPSSGVMLRWIVRDPRGFVKFASDLNKSDLSLHRIRRELFDRYINLIDMSIGKHEHSYPADLHYSIVSCLTARSERIDDNKILACLTGVAQILNVLGPLEAQMERFFGTDKVKDEIAEMRTSITTAVERAEKRIDERVGNIEKSVADGSRAIVSLKDHILSILSNSFKTVKENLVKVAEMFSSLLISLATCYHTTDNVVRLGVLSSWALSSGLATSVVNGIYRLALRSGLKAQGDDDEERESILTAVSEVVKAAFSKLTNYDMSKTVKRVSLMNAYMKFIKIGYSSITFILHVFEIAFHYVYEWWYGYPYVTTEQEQLWKDITSWLRSVFEIIQDEPDLHSAVIRGQVHALMHQSDGLAAKISETQMMNSTTVVFMDTRRRLADIHVVVQRFERVDKGRIKPLFVQICGKADQGKSVLASMLTRDIMKAVGLTYSPEQEWCYSGEDDHDEGYEHQFACIMDDFFQNPDEAYRTKIMMKVIRMANDATCSLTMAFQGKGHTFFDSRLLIATANSVKTPGASVSNNNGGEKKTDGVKPALQSMLAFMSRRDILAEVVSKSMISHDSNVRTLKADRITPQVYQIQLYNVRTEEPEGEPIDYPTFLQLCLQRYIEIEEKEGNIKHVLAVQELEEDVQLVVNRFNKIYKDKKIDDRLEEISKSVGKTELKAQGDDDDYDTATPKITKDKPDANSNESLFKALDNAGIPPSTTKQGIVKVSYWSKIKKLAVRIKDALLSAVKYFGELAKESFKTGVVMAGAFITFLLSIRGIAYVMELFKKPQQEDIEAQSGPINVLPRSTVTTTGVPVRSFSTYGGQQQSASSDDPAAFDIVEHVLPKNVCYGKTANGRTRMLALGEQDYLAPRHLIEDVEKQELTITFLDGEQYTVDLNQSTIVKSEVDDQVFITVPNTVPARKSIVKHFLHDEDLKHISGNTVGLVVLNSKHGSNVRTTTEHPERMSRVVYDNSSKTLRKASNQNTYCFKNISTFQGECGSPYLLLYTKIPRKIFGIHVAGGPLACCSIVTQETIRAALPRLVAQMEPTPVIDISIFNDSGVARFLRTVPPKEAVRMPGKSSKVVSPISGVLAEPDCAPAMLKPTNGIKPVEVTLKKKVSRPLNTYNDQYLERAITVVSEMIPHKVIPRILTMDEALNGPDGAQFLGPVEVKTSPGYPYNTEHLLGGGKAALLTRVGERLVPTDRIKNKVEEALDFLGKGIAPDFIVCDNLKDELLPFEKVEKGQTRIMNTMPLEILILERMYTGMFFENIMRWRAEIDSFCSLGMNAHDAFSYKKVHQKIKQYSEKVLAGDIKSMDASLQKVILRAVNKVIINWYKPFLPWAELFKLELLLTSLCINVKHIVANVIYEQTSNTSGRFLTTIINSIAMVLLWTACVLCKSTESQTYIEYMAPRLIETFGDDHVIGKLFEISMLDFAEYLSRFGIEYTSIDKKSSLPEYYHISEVTYLKRYFVQRGPFVWGALDRKVIEQIPNYITKEEGALLSCCESTLREAFLWGKPVFKDYKTKINVALAKAGYPKITLNYRHLYAEHFNAANALVAEQVEVDLKFMLRAQLETANLMEYHGPREVVAIQHDCEPLEPLFRLSSPFKIEPSQSKWQMEPVRNLCQTLMEHKYIMPKLKQLVEITDPDYVPGLHSQMEPADDEEPYERVWTTNDEKAFRQLAANQMPTITHLTQSNFCYTCCRWQSLCICVINMPVPPPRPLADWEKDITRLFKKGVETKEEEEESSDSDDECFFKDFCTYCESFYCNCEEDSDDEIGGSIDKDQYEENDNFVAKHEQMEEDYKDYCTWCDELKCMCDPKKKYDRDHQWEPRCDVCNHVLAGCGCKMAIEAQGELIVEEVCDECECSFDVCKCRMELQAQMEPITAVAGELKGGQTTVQTTTEFVDEAGKTNPTAETPTTVMSVAQGMDPYPDQGLSTILKRPYPIVQVTWSTAGNVGDVLTTLTFPDMLMAIPNIADKLNRFQYLRSGIKVGCRINGTINHAGKLLISWLPHYNNNNLTTFAPFTNMYSAAANNSLMVSANTNGVVEWIMPFVGPLRFWNMKDLADSGQAAYGMFGYVNVYILHPLTLQNATSVSSLEVTFYANFEDPAPAGWGLRTGSAVSRLRAQGKEGKNKSKNKVMSDDLISGMITPFTTLAANLGGMVSNTVGSLTKGATGAVNGVLDAGTGAINSGLAGATGSLAGIMAQTYLAKPTDLSTVTKVIRKNTTSMALAKGLDGAEKLAMDPENQVADDWRIFCTPCDYNLFANYKLLPGLVMVGSFNDGTAVGTNVIQIPITPTFVHFRTITGPPVHQVYSMTPLANLCSFFKFWRGGVKFHIVFTCSKMTACRLRIHWLPDPTHAGSMASNEDGDVANRVISIMGDTSTSVLIPYLREVPWLDVVDPYAATTIPSTAWTGMNGQLEVTLLNPVVSNNQTAGASIVWFAVYMSGAEDFEVSRPTYLWNGYTDAVNQMKTIKGKEEEERPRRAFSTLSKSDMFANYGKGEITPGLRSQMETDLTDTSDMRAHFRKPFPSLVPTSSKVTVRCEMGEEVTSWPELMKRYHYYNVANGQQTFILSPWTYRNGVHAIDRVRRSFLFSRGSIRWKGVPILIPQTFMVQVTNTDSGDPVTVDSSSDEGMLIQRSDTNPVFEWETPYYVPYIMMPNTGTLVDTGHQASEIIMTPDNSAPQYPNVNYYMSVGDDFLYGVPCAPIQLTSQSMIKQEKAATEPQSAIYFSSRVIDSYQNVSGVTSSQKSVPNSSLASGGNVRR